MAVENTCEYLKEHIVDTLDDDLEPALSDHIASCDACRDFRHEARGVALAVAGAGADFVASDDFEARLLASIDARTRPHGDAVAEPTPAPVQSIERVRAPAEHRALVDDARALRRSRALWAGGAVLASAAAIAAIVPFAVRTGTGESTVARRTHVASEGWSGTLDLAARASSVQGAGVEMRVSDRGPFVPLAIHASVPAGAEIRTDERTRAQLTLNDGTHFVLDRATDVRFDATTERSAALVRGALVADVVHRGDASVAHVTLPNGSVTVLGTRFALTVADARSTVRVTRGTVRLRDASGREAVVNTGEDGVLLGEGGPEVSPAVNLSESVAWSEMGGARSQEADAPIVGVGELRARRPGQSDETAHHLAIASHAVHVRIAGNMARTEVDEVFSNDTAHELEGIFRFPLPPAAQIEKLSLDVNGSMQDGEFVDRQRGQAIWHGVIQNAVHPIAHTQQTDDLVWVPGPWRDPALLEWQRGGRFELRIFPIPAHGSRRVSIAYTQHIEPSAGVRRYVYPLAHDADGSTRIGEFDLDVQVVGNDVATGVSAHGYAMRSDPSAAGTTRMSYSQRDFVPAGDLLVEYALPARDEPVTTWAYRPPVASSTAALADRSGAPESAYVAIALRPRLPRWSDGHARDYALVVDASRSMIGERLRRAADLVRTMISQMDPRDRVVVLACDTECRSSAGGLQFAGASAVNTAEQFLRTETADGASDIGAQVRAAAVALGTSSDRDARIVYLGDGAATAGFRRPELLAAAVGDSLPDGRTTLTTVALGTDSDTTVLDAIARAGGGASVPYVPGETVATAAMSVLETTYGLALRDAVVTLPAGLTEISPERLPTLRAGSETVLVARMDGEMLDGDVQLSGSVGGEHFDARYPVRIRTTSDPGNAFVPRLFAAQRIAALDADASPMARDEIVSLSERFHVASRYTSLLVLESEAMYEAFGVRHGAHSDAAWTGEQTALAAGTVAADERSTDSVPTDDANGEQVDPRSDASGYGTGSRDRASVATDESAPVEATPAAPVHAQTSMTAPVAVVSATPNPSTSTSRFAAGGAVAMEPMGHPPAWNEGHGRAAGSWMRRIWVRRASIDTSDSHDDLEHAANARVELSSLPDSRGRHAALYRWLSLAGDLAAANEVATHWAERDALDPEALARLSDIAARRGERAHAVRILAGIVDVRPDDAAGLERMATLEERAGAPNAACAYRVSLAEVKQDDAGVLSAALRCLDAAGDSRAAARLANATHDPAVRTRATGLAWATPDASEALDGDLVLDGAWDTPTDLDLSIIDGQGRRLSWMGGRRHGIGSRGSHALGLESLGLSRLGVGTYVIEVSRAGGDLSFASGHVTIRALGRRRTLPFTLSSSEATARVARISVNREAQFVPL